MSTGASTVPSPSSGPTTSFGIATVFLVLITLAVSWTSLGSVFYQRITPFYDSLAYQQSYVATVKESVAHGPWAATVSAWKSPAVTAVLYRLFAALFGPEIADGKEGLYVYLNTVHLAAMAALVYAVWRTARSWALALFALAAWLSATPLTQAVSGVLDQRMDLASGSFCLSVAALLFGWSRKPSLPTAFVAGVVAALAILHRPVMAGTVLAMIALFAVRTFLRDRREARFWVRHGIAMGAPLLLLVLPWLVAHRAPLYQYYVVANVDVGSATSWRDAASYNLTAFAGHCGTRYGWMLLVGFVWSLIFRRIDWLDTIVVVLATAVPLVLLIISKSVGNFIVCQNAIGLPALLLACAWPKTAPKPAANHFLWVIIACVTLLWSEAQSLQALRYQVATRSPETRVQSLRVITELSSINVGPQRRLAGFQAFPLDPLALCVMATEQGFPLEAGTRMFHPVDFGLSNENARGISDEAMRGAVMQTLEKLRGVDTLLMVPAEGAQLPVVPFSQTKMNIIREAVAANPAFQRLLTTSPIGGVRFDIYEIKPH
jgi:hypothetical protein